MKINPAKTDESTLGAFSRDIDQPLSIRDRNLISAARAGILGDLRAAMRCGANVNVKDSRGYTPLMILADIDNLRGVQFLIDSGADVKAQSTGEGFTALMIAANSAIRIGCGNAIVDALLNADPSDAHVNCVSHSGVTALMISLSARREKMSLKLHDAGANINLLNDQGDSALTFAVKNQDLKTVEFLLREKFPLSRSQVWEAIGIAVKNNIPMCLTLWLAIEKNPENFIDSSEECVIPDEVLRFRNPGPQVSVEDLGFNCQDRNANPAIALANPYVPAAVPDNLNDEYQSAYQDSYYSEYWMNKPIYMSLSEEESEDELSTFTPRRRLFDHYADVSHPDNQLVQLPNAMTPDPGGGTAASNPNGPIDIASGGGRGRPD
ncbi:ankyrin repeat domain-containing protein [Comamonas antarctica]|uniref:Ankyrin repeat domain-containing protein n=1 Tax=Comamonas antarctica TaxID=2743470 RepID=A0A6N1X219_9BURK|nr:ankyrin repeat domain-containing protein [Comamonas antarctica]QKV53391.1 ankyrin repeat domain-containing protein [Comamonas antarctica]